MQKVVVDCTPQKDDKGRTLDPVVTVRDLTSEEQAAYDALQLVPPVTETVGTVVGRVTMAVIDGTSKSVTFSKTMRTTDYVVTMNPLSSLSVNLWATSKSATGFTLNVSLAISGTIEYIAQEVT